MELYRKLKRRLIVRGFFRKTKNTLRWTFVFSTPLLLLFNSLQVKRQLNLQNLN